MRPLTKAEKFLSGIFALAALVVVVIFGSSFVRKELDGAKRREIDLKTQLEELNTWVGEATLWNERAEWMAENQPPIWDEETSESGLVEQLQKSLGDAGIEINSQRLLATSDLAGYREIGIDLTLKGRTEAVIRWLHGLQQPGEFVAIRQMSIKSDPDKVNLRVDISLVRHYLEGEVSGGEAPPNES